MLTWKRAFLAGRIYATVHFKEVFLRRFFIYSFKRNSSAPCVFSGPTHSLGKIRENRRETMNGKPWIHYMHVCVILIFCLVLATKSSPSPKKKAVQATLPYGKPRASAASKSTSVDVKKAGGSSDGGHSSSPVKGDNDKNGKDNSLESSAGSVSNLLRNQVTMQRARYCLISLKRAVLEVCTCTTSWQYMWIQCVL